MPYIGNITQDFNVNNAMLDTDSVTSIKIVDGTIEGADIAANLDLSDSQRIRFGVGNDLQIYHDGSNSYVDDLTGTGALRLRTNQIELLNNSGDEKYFIGITNQQVELYYDNSKKFETTSAGAQVTGNLSFDDNGKASFGASGDLQIFHNGSNSLINDLGTGGVIIAASKTNIMNAAAGENMAVFNDNGSVELYHNNSQKFVTTSTGVTVTGGVTSGTGGLITTGNVESNADNSEFRCGANADFKISHSGTENILRSDSPTVFRNAANNETLAKLTPNGSVELYHNNSKMIETVDVGVRVGDSKRYVVGDDNDGYLRYNSNTVEIYVAHAQPFKVNLGSETALLASANGAVELYYDNSKKFETANHGVTFFGTGFHGDNIVSAFGNASELQIYHNGTDSIIKDTRNSGTLRIHADSIAFNDKDVSETMLLATADGSVDLYHNGSKKFETRSGGVTVSSTLGIANVGGDLAGSGGGQDYIGIRDSSANFAFMVKTAGTNNGFVGIGETVPLAPLHIKPASNVSQLLIEQNNATDGYALFQDGPNGGHLKFMRHINGSETQKLLLRSDGGLCFGTDSATANALDDYEEGTWTPTSRDGSVTASKAFYTKIGRQVTLHCRLESFTDNSTNDQVTIQGIPFAVNSDKCDIAHGTARYQNISETNNTVCFITHGRQGFNFSGGDSGAFSQIRYNELSSSSRIDLIATYFTG